MSHKELISITKKGIAAWDKIETNTLKARTSSSLSNLDCLSYCDQNNIINKFNVNKINDLKNSKL